MRPLGAQLKRLRLERRLSQERLAELANLNYKYIGRIEGAKANAGADVLVRLARALSVPVGALFETITPKEGLPHRLSPTDIETISGALATVNAAFERVVTRQPHPLPLRAPRTVRSARR